jgi:hypothetical protein
LRKVPIGATTWVKLDEDAGLGQLSVWKNFHMDKPETLDVDFAFPPLNKQDMGSLVIRFRPDTTAPTDSGTTTLTLARPDGAWRYEVQAEVGGGKDSVVTVHDVPAGGYQALSKAYPGSGKWWSAPIDSVHVVAGKTNEYILHARAR